ESLLTTALLVSAVALGIGFEVPSAANLAGYRDEILDQGLSSGFGHVRVRPGRGNSFGGADALAARLATIPGVADAVPVLALAGTVGFGGHSTSVTVFGVDPTAGHRPYRVVAGGPLPPV